jgi:hypothetical protein
MNAGPLAAKRRREATRLFQAIMLAPRIEICEALLRGEKVHRSHLDHQWLRRFGL